MIRNFSFLLIGILVCILSACDDGRVYEDYKEFNSKAWRLRDTASFEFLIADTSKKYNLKFNVRNTLDYPYARLFVNYKLTDVSNNPLASKMISGYLFDQKTGKPLGNSGLGDIYDNQFPLLDHYSFHKAGKYRVRFEQFMRLDTLPGILAAGLRVELAEESKE